MRSFLHSIAIVAIVLLSFNRTYAAEQCGMIPVPLQQRVNASSVIVEAEVVSTQSYWNAQHTMIFTQYVLNVYKSFKGTVPDEISLITQGGQVGLEMINFTSNSVFATGDQAVFFLKPTRFPAASPRTNTYELESGPQGAILYDLVEKSAMGPFDQYPDIQTILYPAIQSVTGQSYSTLKQNKKLTAVTTGSTTIQAVPTITSFSPTSITGGTRSLLTINGTNFGATRGNGFVEFKNANDGGATYVKAKVTDYQSWSDTQIKVWVPSSSLSNGPPAGTGNIRVTNNDPNSVVSAGTLTVTWSRLNVEFNGFGQKTEHQNDNGSGGYTFQFESTTFNTNSAATAAFMRALHNWTCNTNINWSVGATSAVNVIAEDGINIVRFDVGAELATGTLGRATSYLSGCGTGTDTIWTVTEMDVVYDNTAGNVGYTWNYSTASPTVSQIDFESVTVHELGHAHQLAHIISPGAVMHYSLSNGAMARILNAGSDLAGGDAVLVQGFAGNICKAAMSSMDLTASISITSNAAGNTICSGTNVTFTSTATVPAGTFTYQWKKNGVNVSTTPNFTTNVIANGDVFTCVLTVSGGCNQVITSNAITMSVNPVASVSISGDAFSWCSGYNRTFTAFPTNGGTSPSYQWKVNGVNVGTNSNTYSSSTLANNDQVTCVMTSNAPCVSNSPATSNTLTVQVRSVSINTNNLSPCANSSVTYSAVVNNNGFQINSYSWTKNGVPVSSSSFYVSNSNSNGDVIVCNVSIGGIFNVCTASSPPFVVSTTPATQTPNGTINVSPSPSVCSGSIVNFSVNLTNPVAPTFQWRSNGTPIPGATGSVYANVFTASQYIDCIVTNNGTCGPATAVINGYTLNVLPVPVITSSGPGTVCSDDSLSIQLSTTAPNTVYSWTTSSLTGNTSPLPNGSQTSSLIKHPVSVINATSGIVRYTINAVANSCNANPITKDIIVRGKPSVVSAGSGSPAVCSGQSVSLLSTGSYPTDPGFAGVNIPGAFTFTINPLASGGSWNISDAPTSITITGGNNNQSGTAVASRLMTATGSVSFKWEYSTIDGANWDRAIYTINGVSTLLPGFSTAGLQTQSGYATIPVTSGQNFGFGIFTTDGQFGEGVLKVSYICTPEPAAMNWYSLTPPSTFTSIGVVASDSSLTTTPVNSPTHTYKVLATGNGCVNDSGLNVNVGINPLPTGEVIWEFICNGGTTNIGIVNTNVPLQNITWTTSPVAGVTGNSNCSGTCGTMIQQTLLNSTTSGKTVEYVVTPTSTDGCAGPQFTTYAQIQSDVFPVGSIAVPGAVCTGDSASVWGLHNYQSPGFSGVYQDVNWTISSNPSNSGGASSSDFRTLTMVSGNNGFAGYYEYSIVMNASGFVTFRYDYTTVDAAQYDYPVYAINGVETVFPGFNSSGGSIPQSGNVSIPVSYGQTFSLRMRTVDGIFGSATVKLSNFEAPVPGLIYWYDSPAGGNLLGISDNNEWIQLPVTGTGSTSFYAQGYSTENCISPGRVQSSLIYINNAPVITSVTPNSGTPGTSVQLLGNYFYDATVYFNGIPVAPDSVSNNFIDVTVPPGATTGTLTVETDCGTTSAPFTVPVTTALLNLKIFLQGLYEGGQSMVPALYNSGVSPTNTVADTITVELRASTSPFQTLHSQQVVLQRNGLGQAIWPSAVLSQSFYLVVRHRNSLETWSKNPVVLGAATFYDFSAPAP